MRIVERYSHLNGWEHLIVHKPHIWADIENVIAAIDAHACRTKVSNEKGRRGTLLFSPEDMNKAFKSELVERGWQESRVSYWVTGNVDTIKRTLHLPTPEQKKEIEKAGETPLFSYNQTDFVKERVEIEVQFGKYSFASYDIFVKHMAFYIGEKIDVGVEILPMKELQKDMSSGVPYYEGEIYNVIRQGRGIPAVPLVIIGIAP